MNIEEIRKNAPKSAQFYAVIDGKVLYLKAIGGWWYLWGIDNWILFNSLNVAEIRDYLHQL